MWSSHNKFLSNIDLWLVFIILSVLFAACLFANDFIERYLFTKCQIPFTNSRGLKFTRGCGGKTLLYVFGLLATLRRRHFCG